MIKKAIHKINYKVIIANSIILILAAFLLILVHQDYLLSERTYTKDISVSEAFYNDKPYDVHLVTYADGKEVHYRNQNTLAQTAINKGFDVIHLYNKKHLDKDFQEKNSHILGQKHGVGYWLWKPYIILKALSGANKNDIIIYIDSGSIINPDLVGGISSLIDIIHSSNKDIFIFEDGLKIGSNMKRDLMIYFNMDSEEYREKNQMMASFIAFKNTQGARDFVSEWLALCENEQLLTDKPSIAAEHPGFRRHLHDQSILTLLTYKHPNIVSIFPPYSAPKWFPHHRRREDMKDRTLFVDWDRSF